MTRFICFILMLICLISCDDRTQSVDDPIPDKPIVFHEVNADETDIGVARAYSFDIHVDGTLDYEDGYYYSPITKEFNLAFPFYKASYEAGSMPLMSPRMHNSLMCSNDQCDSSGSMMSGVWYRYDLKPSPPSMVWKFITTDTKNGYNVVMNDLPKPIEFVDIPEFLSTTSDNVLHFNYIGTDSLLLALLAIPKDNLDGMSDPGLISNQFHFPIIAEDNRFNIPAEVVKQTSIPSTDTVFINLISLKRVFKVIEGKKVAINYKKNHFYPVIIK